MNRTTEHMAKSAPSQHLEEIARLVRALVVDSTTTAGSGHPTSCLSAVDIAVTLMFGGTFRADLKRPQNASNDRIIFSKGHAAPLLYALYAVAGVIPVSELKRLRRFGSRLEGHPMPAFRYVEAPTGSLGQGLSYGIGEAVAATLDRLPYRTYVLIGDGETAEGSFWEAVQLASHKKIGNLTAIVDMNRLGQSGPTMLANDARLLERRITSFGWKTHVVDGHSIPKLQRVFRTAAGVHGKPVMIIARTIKGKGVSFLENREGWHGKTLDREERSRALKALGPIDRRIRGVIASPERVSFRHPRAVPPIVQRSVVPVISVREAIGRSLVRSIRSFPRMVVLDADVKNSTYLDRFAARFPSRFVETFIAEQNMVGIMIGLAARGHLPVAATFASFWTRAYDQLRMAQYAGTHVVCIGTHAGVHVGEDGPSQMGLEDIAMFRSLQGSTVLYPADAGAAEKLLVLALRSKGIVYIRATRATLPVMHPATTTFRIGGSRTILRSNNDQATIVGAGATIHEALKAALALKRRGISIRVIDCYSVKPIDAESMQRAARETRHLVVVEDHRQEGGIAEAVRSSLGAYAGTVRSLSVHRTPRSGKPDQLYAYEGIDSQSIFKVVRRLIPRNRT